MTREVYIHWREVAEELQGLGLGTQLLSALVDKCVERGVDTLTTDVINEAALASWKKLFGEDALGLRSRPDIVSPPDPTPLSYGQAMEALARGDTIVAWVDL